MICGGIYYCALRCFSPNEVKRIWHLEPTLGETALEIALLIPDSCNDRVSCLCENELAALHSITSSARHSQRSHEAHFGFMALVRLRQSVWSSRDYTGCTHTRIHR